MLWSVSYYLCSFPFIPFISLLVTNHTFGLTARSFPFRRAVSHVWVGRREKGRGEREEKKRVTSDFPWVALSSTRRLSFPPSRPHKGYRKGRAPIFYLGLALFSAFGLYSWHVPSLSTPIPALINWLPGEQLGPKGTSPTSVSFRNQLRAVICRKVKGKRNVTAHWKEEHKYCGLCKGDVRFMFFSSFS